MQPDALSPLPYAACALVFAVLVNLLYRLAGRLHDRGHVAADGLVMLPGIFAIVGIAVLWLDLLDRWRPQMVDWMACAVLIGMNVGQVMPRPRRRRPDRDD